MDFPKSSVGIGESSAGIGASTIDRKVLPCIGEDAHFLVVYCVQRIVFGFAAAKVAVYCITACLAPWPEHSFKHSCFKAAPGGAQQTTQHINEIQN